MRTEALLLSALLFAGLPVAHAEDDVSSRFELNAGAEATLVGLTFGVRPELLVRPGDVGSVSRLRFAVGMFGGQDQLFVPFSLGYRAVFRQGMVIQPQLGVGLEMQLRAVSDLPVVRQFGVYLETGLGFMLSERWSLGAMFSFDLMLFGGPGFGFGPRIYAGYRF